VVAALDRDVGGEAKADCFRRDERDAAQDDPGRLQPLDALPSGCLRQPDLPREQTVTIPLETQLTEAWLGGGDKSGVAKILASTAEFLKSQKKITTVRDAYADAVAPELASGALKLTN
jgi:ABC-type taurine transport system substrate-binding protein